MPITILMPALSPTMTEGNLARWLKNEGDSVAPGDVIAEIETDKATMEVESVDEGILGKILVAEGTEEIPVNTPIAIILEEGEDSSALAGFDAVAAAPAAAPPAAPEPAAPAPAAATSAPAPKPAAVASNKGERVFASPLARRMAEQQGIDLSTVNGSGPNGRIVKADIEAYAGGGVAAVSPTTAPAATAAPIAGETPFDLVPVSNIRKVVARRLTESKQQVPHFYLTVDCQIDALLGVRADLNARAKNGEFKISVNDMVIKACAVALMQVPAANASWSDDGIKMYRQADISVAVAIDDGLITPIVRNANGKGMRTISEEMRDLATRARDGSLAPEEYQGGTFSISNLGMFGIKDFQAIINPPQGCILAVGAGEQRPIVKEGALAIATIMSCTLSVDHRVVDGAVGAEFLAAFKALIEDPLGMLL
ncbi:MAG: pyruvate dehydrogenase E2 component (dihydrolipoamide acetyltransferase) [Alphaproteobacteria bacterium]|jgi:pyruvate dehydrogenase E2 component (dihydrolipoamide acetyltransferase)